MILAFEVMDKEPSLLTVWGAALALGVIGFAAARFRRWLVVPALGIVGIAAWIQLGKLADPLLGPGIMQEDGRSYLFTSCADEALADILTVLGLHPTHGTT